MADWAGSSAKRCAPLPVYAEAHQTADDLYRQVLGAPGDPHASTGGLLEIVDARQPPLRVFFGSRPLHIVKAIYHDRIANWEGWQTVSVAVGG